MRKSIEIITVTYNASTIINDRDCRHTIYNITMAGGGTTCYFMGTPVKDDKVTLNLTCDGTSRTVAFDTTLYTKSVNAGSLVMIPSTSYEVVFIFNGVTWVEQSRKIISLFAPEWSAPNIVLTTTTASPLINATVGLKSFIKSLIVTNSSTAGYSIQLIDGASTVIWSAYINANQLDPLVITFPDKFGSSVNSALSVKLNSAPSSSCTVSAIGYQGL